MSESERESLVNKQVTEEQRERRRQMEPTFVCVLIDVSNVLHCQSKHGVSGSVQTHRSDVLPTSCLVDVDVDGAADVTVLHVELRGAHYYILPSMQK